MAVRPVLVELGSKLEDSVLADIADALLNDTPVLLKINIPDAMQTVVYDAIMELKRGGDFEKNVLNKKETVMDPMFTTIPYTNRANFPNADKLWRSVCKSLNAMPQNYTGETFVGGALVETDQVVEHTNTTNIWHGAPVYGVNVSGASNTSNPRLKTHQVAKVDQKFYTSKTKASTKAHWHAPPVINYHFYGSTKKVYRFCGYKDSNKIERFRCGEKNESYILGYEIGRYQEANAIIFPHGMVHEIETHIDYERSFDTGDPIDVLTYGAETDDVKHYLGLGTYIMLDVVIADRISFVQKVLFDIKGMSKKEHWKRQFSGTTLEVQDIFQNIHDVWLSQLGKTKKILNENSLVRPQQRRIKSPTRCFDHLPQGASSSSAAVPPSSAASSAAASGAPPSSAAASAAPPSSAASSAAASAAPPSSAASSAASAAASGKRSLPPQSSERSKKRQLTPHERGLAFVPSKMQTSKRPRAEVASSSSAAQDDDYDDEDTPEIRANVGKQRKPTNVSPKITVSSSGSSQHVDEFVATGSTISDLNGRYLATYGKKIPKIITKKMGKSLMRGFPVYVHEVKPHFAIFRWNNDWWWGYYKGTRSVDDWVDYFVASQSDVCLATWESQSKSSIGLRVDCPSITS